MLRIALLLAVQFLLANPALPQAAYTNRISFECKAKNDIGQIRRGQNYILAISDNDTNPLNTYEMRCERSFSGIHIEFDGEIKEIDSVVFERIRDGILRKQNSLWLLQRSTSLIDIFINSTGGSVVDAMRIGRAIRQLNGSVTIRERSFCYSSCVFLIAGAVNRAVYSDHVAIHRPYFRVLHHLMPLGAVEAQVSRNDDLIRVYLTEMGIPGTLFDAMRAVPPEQMQFLSDQELRRFLLIGRDPGYDERWTAFQAWKHGLNSADFRARVLQADRQCNTREMASLEAIRRRLDCLERIRYGITEFELSRRRERVRAACSSLPEDRTEQEMRQSELEAFINCSRNIMIGARR